MEPVDFTTFIVTQGIISAYILLSVRTFFKVLNKQFELESQIRLLEKKMAASDYITQETICDILDALEGNDIKVNLKQT